MSKFQKLFWATKSSNAIRKMKNFYLIFILSFCFFVGFSQESSKLQQSLSKLELEKNEVKRLDLLMEILEQLPDGNNKKIDYLLEAEKLALQQKKDKKLSDVYFKFIVWSGIKGEMDMFIKYSIKSNKLSEKIKDYENLIRSTLYVSQYYILNKRQFDKAKIYIDKAEKIILKTKTFNLHSDVFIQRGFIEYYKGNFEKALTYYFQAVDLAKKINSQDLPSFYIEVGLAYTQLKKPEKAFEYFDKAKFYLEKYPEVNQEQMAYLYSDIAFTHASTKNYAKAIEAFNISMKHSKDSKNLRTQMENYSYIAEMYAGLKDFKNENENLKKHYHLKDSLLSVDKQLKQSELIADYEIEKKNVLVAQKELESTKSKSQRNLFIGIALSSLLLFLAMIFFYSRIQKKNKLIVKQKFALEELNTVKDRLFAILSHDLRNPLVTLKSFLSLSANKELAPEKLEKYQAQTHQTLSQTTALLDNLLLWANNQLKNTKPHLKQLDLEEIILDVVDGVEAQANQKLIEIQVNIIQKTAVSNQQILELAIRNILTNAIKFSSEQGIIKIASLLQNDKTCILIQDFGKGMTQEQIDQILALKSKTSLGTNNEKGSGLGLFLVVELLTKINVKLQIQSQENTGSTFVIAI